MGEFLKKRAEEFLNEAQENLIKEKYNLSVFHCEQALQLFLKYWLFRKLGDFPKTHSINQLLDDYGKTYNTGNIIEKIKSEYQMLISNLEAAYILSRYLPHEYDRGSAEAFLDFTKMLIAKHHDNIDRPVD